MDNDRTKTNPDQTPKDRKPNTIPNDNPNPSDPDVHPEDIEKNN